MSIALNNHLDYGFFYHFSYNSLIKFDLKNCFNLMLNAFSIYVLFSYVEEVSKVKVKLVTLVKINPKAPFSIATTTRCREGATSFPGLVHFNFDPYLMMLSLKQGGIKYHFLSLWYDMTWN